MKASLGQEQHLLHSSAGGHQPEARGEGVDQEGVAGHQAQHQGQLGHRVAPLHVPALLGQVVHADLESRLVLTTEEY